MNLFQLLQKAIFEGVFFVSACIPANDDYLITAIIFLKNFQQ